MAADLRARRPENWISIADILFTVSRPVMDITQVLIKRLPGAIYPTVKPPRRETDHSLLSTAEVSIHFHISWYTNN
jgi:hypothetical protein